VPLPEGFAQLAQRYRLDLPAGAVLYEQGSALRQFYVVLSGRIAFEAAGPAGAASEVQAAPAGATVGVVSAFTQRPTSAAARASEASSLLAIPVEDAEAAFQTAPALAVGIIRELAGRGGGRAATVTPPSLAAAPVPALAATTRTSRSRAALSAPFDEKTFFKDDIACPVCELTFEFLRVRASAVRPERRDSDFRIAYSTVDPNWYAVVACPRCGYASYAEDFGDLRPDELQRLRGAAPDRPGAPALSGERSVDDAVAAIELALRTNELRGGGARRRAGLLQRAAWLARGRRDEAGEHALLEQTLAAYREVYEQDTGLGADTAMRVAYLIGDLSARVGLIDDARSWLLNCTRMEGADQQTGLLRMARSRLEDLRDGGSVARSA
jgi:uncharacterized protein (DUF2225 family)